MSALSPVALAHPDCLFIGGQWIKPQSAQLMEVVSPVTEQVIARVAEGTTADVDQAVEAARAAFDAQVWSLETPQHRAEKIAALAAKLRERADDLAKVWTEQTGVIHRFAKSSPEYSIKALDMAIAQAESFEFIEPHSISNGQGYLVREAVGVVAAIAPWNAPLATMLYKLGPALVAGCTVIMKPAPQTPLEAFIIAECAEAAGFPPGVINMITADRDASDHLISHPGVDKVAFTGSVAVGQRIASVLGQRIGRVTLELGGKSAAIVLDDFDLDVAAKKLASGIVMMTGQNCAALTRVLVPRAHHDALAEKLKAHLEQTVVGDPYDEATQMGPLAMERQLERVEAMVADGQKEGATLVTGGSRPAAPATGYFFQPTLLANVSNDMSVAREEIFGPVLCLIPYDSEDEAVEIANDSPFGLAGAVFTNDNDKAMNIARRMRTGTVGHNGSKADFAIAFGGFKQSGLGREGGVEGLLPYLEAKTLLME